MPKEYAHLMKPIGKPAFIAAIIGPIQSVLGWSIAGALWVGYDPSDRPSVI
jgi:hypothetical protein